MLGSCTTRAMEVRTIDERMYEGGEPTLVYQCSPSPRELSSIKLVADDDGQASETCEHFTIRGYVAGVRKKNAKICWPFSMSHNYKPDEYGNSLPPLPVIKFKRWNCQNCLRESSINGNLPSGQNAEIRSADTSFLKSFIVASHDDKKIQVPGIQQLSENKILEGQFAKLDSSKEASSCRCHHSICCAKKENESVITDLTTKGFHIPKASKVIQEKGHTPASVTKEVSGIVHEENIVQPTLTSGAAHDGDAIDILCAKLKGTSVVDKFVGSEMDDEFDENDHGASDNTADLTEHTVRCHHARKPLISGGNLHPKKARKVRLLADILKSEELDRMCKKARISNGDAKASQDVDDTGKRPDALLKKVQWLDQKNNLTNQKTNIEPIKDKRIYRALGNEEIEKKHINTADVDCKSSKYISARKDLNCIRKGYGFKGNKKKVLVQRKPNEVPRFYLGPQKSIIARKGLMVVDDIAIKNTNSKLREFKSIRTTGNGPHCSSKHQERSHQVQITVNKKKNCEPRVEKNESTQKQLLKSIHLVSQGSFGKQDHTLTTSTQEQKRVAKKRRTTRMFIEDIPMDIVKLLAKNQHERRLMAPRNEMIQDSSKLCANMETGDSMNDTDGHRNTVVKPLFKDLSRQNNIVGGIKNNKIADRNLVSGHINGTMNKYLNPNEEHRYQPMSCAQPPKWNSSNNCFAQFYAWNRAGMQASESPDIVPVQSSIKNTSGFSSVPLNSARNGFRPHYSDPGSNHTNIVPQRELKISAHGSDKLKWAHHGNHLMRSTSYGNETLPAMHLLRLMDSGSSLHTTTNINNTGFMAEPGRSLNFEHRVETNEPPIHPSTIIGQTIRDQGHESSWKPFRPLPVVGMLGSLLQKEIAACSSNCTSQFGFGTGNYNGPSIHRSGKENTGFLETDTGARDQNAQKPVFGDEKMTELSKLETGSSPSRGESRPLNTLREMEICTVNRNPAEFTELDDENLFMIHRNSKNQQ